MSTKGRSAQIYLIPCSISPDTQHQVIPEEVRQVILKVDHYLVENIRSARRFIASLKLRDVSSIDFKIFDKNTKESELDELMSPLQLGNPIGIMSEAGCPAIADPGNKIVRWAHQHKVQVKPLSGPSSIFLALMGSGMNGQQFEFHGYLPIDKDSRAKKIVQLEKESSQTGKCQIFMETPYRNTSLAESLLGHCSRDTRICIASGLTSKNELIETKTVRQWRTTLPDLQKKPTIFLLQANSQYI